VKYGGTMRIDTTWYPGNPAARQQPIGATEKPTTITGEWNDNSSFLGVDGAAMALMEMLDRIRRAGVSVEVTWLVGGAYTNQVRVGMISNADFTIQRPQDIAWEIEFTWRSRGQVTSPPIAATGKLNATDGFADVASDLQTATSAMQSFVDSGLAKLTGLSQSIADQLGSVADLVDGVTTAITNATAAATAAVLIPVDAAEGLISSCQSGIYTMTIIKNSMLNIELLSLEVKDNALDLIRAMDQILTVLGFADQATESCTDAAAGVLNNIEPDVIAEVRAPAGTDLRDLAIRYYGTADLWWLIANANGIDGSAVPSPPSGPSDDPARALVIPRPQAGASSDLRMQC
jgi:hypothetical protein